MTAITTAARATAWVTSHRDDLARAARAAGLPPHDLDGAGWLAALAAIEAAEDVDAPGVARRLARRAATEVLGCDIVSRPHRGPRARIVAAEEDAPDLAAADLAGGLNPLARLVAAADIAECVAASRWCADAAREATQAPRGRLPDADPRGERTRRRRREYERRSGQMQIAGWGWQS